MRSFSLTAYSLFSLFLALSILVTTVAASPVAVDDDGFKFKKRQYCNKDTKSKSISTANLVASPVVSVSTSTRTSTATITRTRTSSSSVVAKPSTSTTVVNPAPTTKTTAQPAPTDGGADTGNKFNIRDMVKLHNDFRATKNAQPVTWNDAAAAVALNWAKGCKMVHSGTKGYGENLAAGAGGGYSVTSAFNSWASEGKPAEGGYNHYSQVVWKATTGIGCAAVECNPGTLFDAKYGSSLLVVCEYTPPGNYIGQFGTNVE